MKSRLGSAPALLSVLVIVGAAGGLDLLGLLGGAVQPVAGAVRAPRTGRTQPSGENTTTAPSDPEGVLAPIVKLKETDKELLDKFRTANPKDPRLLFLDTQHEILVRLSTNEHFKKDAKAAAWLHRVLTVFMGSLQNALEDKIAPPAQYDGRNQISNPREYAGGMVDFINGKKAGTWWGVAFDGAKKICAVYNAKGITSPSNSEVYAIIMAQAHIKYDLYNALRFEGVGTDKDYAEVGKIVAEASAKFQLNQRRMNEIGAKVLGGAFDIQRVRDDMRGQVIQELQRNWKFDARKNPYEGQKAGILRFWSN
jgi:hypothetical protein